MYLAHRGIASFTILLVAVLLTTSACGNSIEKQPNILLVLIDDCSADELSRYRNKLHHTPVVDQLAKKGARFFDCGESRNPRGYEEYREVSHSTDPEVVAAKQRFMDYLKDKPAPMPTRLQK